MHSNYRKGFQDNSRVDAFASARSEVSVGLPPPDMNFRKRNINTVAYAYQQSSNQAADRRMMLGEATQGMQIQGF